MEGDTKFEDALAARLEIIKPSRSSIEKCLRDSPLRTSPGVDELIAALNARGTDVYFVSGGFRIMIEPVAKKVNVSKSNILANTILFDEDGNYAGFDPEEPTSADMGKPKAVGQIIAEHGYETVVMVGDGATDMQAVPPAKAFIGYGGIAERAAVRDGACWFTKSFDEMTAIVKKFKLAK
jgi:phosphoserine phosphatase